MAVSYGRNVTFAFAKETAYNEAWGSPTLTALYLDKAPEFIPKIETIRAPHLYGRPELNTADIIQGIKNYTLRIDGTIPKESFGFLLLSLFGAVTTTFGTPWYTHIFVPSVTTPASLKLQVRMPLTADNDEWRLSGAIVKSATFDFKQNDFLRFSIDFVGGTFAKHTTVSTATAVLVPAAGNPCFNWNSTPTITMATVALTPSSFSLTFENTLADDMDDSYVFGSAERTRLERAATEDCFKVKGSIKRIWQAVTQYTAWAAFTNQVFLSYFYDPTGSDYAFKVDLANTRLIDYKTTPKGLGLVEEQLDFEAFTTGTAADIKITTIDKQAEPVTQ